MNLNRYAIEAMLVGFLASGLGTWAAELPGGGPMSNPVPDLAWVKRSDWIDVSAGNPATPSDLKAVGDGTVDDTAALQAGLDKLQRGDTLYLPPGTYRITQTLVAKTDKILGITIIGHGRGTVLAWDGPVGGAMFLQDRGWALSRFIGLTWDGRGKAAVGMDFACKKSFETEQRFQHCGFFNFTAAGIRMGVGMKYATAETVYDNCYFENCAKGIGLMNFNVLDHTMIGCEFRRCGIGVFSGKGSNFYARECRFEGSTEVDILFNGEAGSSIRRCTSQGSRQFVSNTSMVAPLVIQDCQVDGWKGASAITLAAGAPVIVFDTVFSNPPSTESPIIRTGGQLIVSDNKADGCNGVVSGKGETHEVPSGIQSGVLKGPGQSFLKPTVTVSGKVFDARVDFGATGDGVVDDTLAIQATIDAARAHGKGALAYLPKGKYVVTASLRLTGTDYSVGGSGFGTALIWKGPAGGTTLKVEDPERLSLENMSIGRHDYAQGANEADIVQTGSAKPSSMRYDRVWVYGMYMVEPRTRGFRAVNLGKNDRVYFKEFNGNVRFTDSADATVYLGTTYEGTVLVEGKNPGRNGFLGGGVRLATVSSPALWVKHNHSIVFSDFYTESGSQFVKLEGGDAQMAEYKERMPSLGTDGEKALPEGFEGLDKPAVMSKEGDTLPAGRVVIQGAKFEISTKSKHSTVEVDNYKGELMVGSYLYYVKNPLHKFTQRGESPFALTLWGGYFYQSKPEVTLGSNGSVTMLGNRSGGVSDSPGTAAGLQVSKALDDLRRLGAVEMEFGFGGAFGD